MNESDENGENHKDKGLLCMSFPNKTVYTEIPLLTVPSTSGTTVKRIFFCRHGETEPNALGVLQGSGIDEPLNERVV